MRQSEGQGRSQPQGSVESQDRELDVLRAGARDGTERPRRRNNNWGHRRDVEVQQRTWLKEQKVDARTMLGSRQGKAKGAKSITLDQSVWSFSFMLPMIFF